MEWLKEIIQLDKTDVLNKLGTDTNEGLSRSIGKIKTRNKWT
ncbi:MAG: hypothetical protein ACRDAO_01380 [Culicoidibacterales bacterium]